MAEVLERIYFDLAHRLKTVNRRLKIALVAAGGMLALLLALLLRQRKPK